MKKTKIPVAWRLFALVTLFMSCLSLNAQQITVSGTVTDSTGEPIIGASVLVVGTTSGVSTDIDGNYSLTADAAGQIKVTYIGYLPQTISIDGKSTINVVLKENAELLDEVVVIGYGTMKKSDLTGAVSSLGSRDIKEVPVNNVGQAI